MRFDRLVSYMRLWLIPAKGHIGSNKRAHICPHICPHILNTKLSNSEQQSNSNHCGIFNNILKTSMSYFILPL